jgi:hypothetical protein
MPPARRFAVVLGWTAVVLLVAVVGGWWMMHSRAPRPGIELVRITGDEGLTVYLALSRDGKLLAYPNRLRSETSAMDSLLLGAATGSQVEGQSGTYCNPSNPVQRHLSGHELELDNRSPRICVRESTQDSRGKFECRDVCIALFFHRLLLSRGRDEARGTRASGKYGCE